MQKYIDDSDMIWLIGEVLNGFQTQEGFKTGLPLGNLTSQLFINIYMNEFDQFVKRTLKARYYIRYADDFVVLHENQEYLENMIPKMNRFLQCRLQLELHPNKVCIQTLASGVDFLGWVHFPSHHVLRTSTKKGCL